MLGPRFDVQGQAAIWAFEELKGIVSNFKLKVDDKFLKEENLTLDGILAEIKSTLNTAERSLDFAKLDSSQPIIQKNLDQAKFFFLVRAGIFKRLEKEAIEHFQKIQENKDLRAAYREYVNRISDANYQRALAETEAQQLAEEKREYEQMIQAEIDRINKEAQADWDAHQKHIKHLENKISDLREQRQQIWDKYEEQITNAVANFKTNDGKHLFADLTKEQQKQLGQDYAVEGEKLKQRIAQLNAEVSKDLVKLNKLDTEENLLKRQIRTQEGPNIIATQERNGKDNSLTPQLGFERKLNSKIDSNERIRAIKKERIELQNEIQAKKDKIPEYENELKNLLRTYLKKHYTPQQIDEMYKENPNLEKEFRKHMKSTPGYMDYKMEIGEVNKEIFSLKGQKETVSGEIRAVVHGTETINRNCEKEFNMTLPTPPHGGFLARRKAMQTSA